MFLDKFSMMMLAGEESAYLQGVVALILVGALIGYVCFRLGIIPIVGFLLAGVLIGPNALGLVENQELIKTTAEIGVILLLFTIGIEFSLERLSKIKRLIFVGGGLQVLLTTFAVTGVLWLIQVDWRVGVYTGFLVALSSTAIVLKLLEDRGESNSTTGQIGLGILIFQDLAIIVMMLLVPILSGSNDNFTDLIWALGKAIGIVVLVLLLARRLMPLVLEIVARTCSPELFLMTVIAICFGTAYVTNLAGVSVSLGAFLAGLIVSESKFSQHALSEILPLRMVFSSIFFISVGMFLDPAFLVSNWAFLLIVLAAVLGIKMLTTGVSVLALGYPLPIAAAAAFMLSQIGEFSFILERAGQNSGLYPAAMAETGTQTVLAITVVLMVLTPLLHGVGMRLSKRLERKIARRRGVVMEAEAAQQAPTGQTGHVIIAGYGQAARPLVRAIAGARIPCVITTLSPAGANEAESEGFEVIRGDSAKARTLRLAGLESARLLVIPDDEPAMAHRITSVARGAAPELPIFVRTRYISDIEQLTEAGSDEVVSEEFEGIAQLLKEVLRQFDVSTELIEANIDAVRHGTAHLLPVTPQIDAVDDSEDTLDTERAISLKTSNGNCSHVDQIRVVWPSAEGCEECLRTGDDWVHLRICMTCGHMGCCDDSPNRHATLHYHDTGHPIMRSMESGESWGWCFVDEQTLS